VICYLIQFRLRATGALCYTYRRTNKFRLQREHINTTAIFLDATPYTAVGRHWRFVITCYLATCTLRLEAATRLHGVISRKTVVLILDAVRTKSSRVERSKHRAPAQYPRRTETSSAALPATDQLTTDSLISVTTQRRPQLRAWRRKPEMPNIGDLRPVD
jgi:hypothetical protein